MGRSIRELKPQEVLALAVAVETRNAQRYDSLAHLFDDYHDEASTLLTEMRDEELEHRSVLQAMYKSRYGDQPCSLDEADVDEVVEAVDLADAEHMIFDSMTRREAFESALRAEQGARQFYSALSDIVEDEELLTLYKRLAAFEEEHVAAIQKRIDSVGREKGDGSNGRNT